VLSPFLKGKKSRSGLVGPDFMLFHRCLDNRDLDSERCGGKQSQFSEIYLSPCKKRSNVDNTREKFNSQFK
jgi:hypothetical protein